MALDHLAFPLSSRAELDPAVAVLDELGVAHAGPKNPGLTWILEFRNPDGFALELTGPNK